MGTKLGWKVWSSMLHVVSAQQDSPSSHSSFEPPGHHLNLPPVSQLVDASIQDEPQKK